MITFISIRTSAAAISTKPPAANSTNMPATILAAVPYENVEINNTIPLIRVNL